MLQKKLGFSNQTDFATALGIKQGSLSDIYRGKNGIGVSDSIKMTLIKDYSINIEWLETGNGEIRKQANSNIESEIIPKGELKPKEYSHTLQVRVVTNKAKAGWADGFYNDEYLEDMPIITIDADESHKGKYLAFEVAGDSMEPDYLEGDIVICREVQRHLWTSKLHIRDWDFVIAHYTEGIMLKEIIEHDVEKGIITCRSLNPNHKDFKIKLREVSSLYNVVEVRQKR
ncbi:LexA family transcriptional regulator [Capnocytophaga canimorsus]|nr:LexA family transcriptional regulator [Capnocytophaga canimorsus]WGU68209.1 LexA family transcriptional regulator [Capnocytophaga canimorsus]WGU70689.1 LexA family transcriptional regulator [Capnocytophaga canimorsus]